MKSQAIEFMKTSNFAFLTEDCNRS